MSEELRACPFCGSKDISDVFMGEWNMPWRVYCHDCYAETAAFENKDNAIEAWQHRPIEDALQAKLEIAVEALLVIAGKTQAFTTTTNTEYGINVKMDYVPTEEASIAKVALAGLALKKLEGE